MSAQAAKQEPGGLRRGRLLIAVLGVLVAAVAGTAAWVWVANRPAPMPPASSEQRLDRANLIARGAYLARAGNCLHCHTARGGAAGAGGRAIETPFGSVYAGNLTPHASGLGGWSADDFWRALYEGRSRDGRLLLPAFPYESFTQVTRDDSDALFAYLQSLAPVDRPPRPHALRWPYDHPWAVAFWRALYFRPQAFLPDPTRSAEWNRGAYLVRGLGHCAACHAPRTGLGGTIASAELGGGLMAAQNWHAPALGGPAEISELVALLGTGRSRDGSALGPMADVVLHSTQHLNPGDLRAMAGYLASLPAPSHTARNDEATAGTAAAGITTLGASLYDKHCAGCHGESGDGQGLYSPLAGNRTVNLASPTNLVKAIREGGFAPNTQANPRPFGMPPFAHVLSDAEIAAVASHVRTQWGNAAGPVSELQVLRAR